MGKIWIKIFEVFFQTRSSVRNFEGCECVENIRFLNTSTQEST